MLPWLDRSDRHLVVTVVGDYLPMFEMAVPCEVFGIRRPEIPAWRYEHIVAAVRPRPIPAGNGLLVTPQAGLEAWPTPTPSSSPAGTRRDRYVEPELVAALLAAHGRGARLVSVCTGAFALAATGLLDGRRATTHWMHAEELAARHPPITVDPSVLYVDEGSILTSAGTAAGIDLASTWCAGTSGPRRPTPSPGAWSSRRTATAGRPSSCRPRCRRAPRTTPSAPCSRGWPSTSTSGSTVDDLAAGRR